MNHVHAQSLNNLEETGPPNGLEYLRRVALCEKFLDMLTYDDLLDNVVAEANNNPKCESYDELYKVVRSLKGNPHAEAVEMLDLLKKLGLNLAFD